MSSQFWQFHLGFSGHRYKTRHRSQFDEIQLASVSFKLFLKCFVKFRTSFGKFYWVSDENLSNLPKLAKISKIKDERGVTVPSN